MAGHAVEVELEQREVLVVLEVVDDEDREVSSVEVAHPAGLQGLAGERASAEDALRVEHELRVAADDLGVELGMVDEDTHQVRGGERLRA